MKKIFSKVIMLILMLTLSVGLMGQQTYSVNAKESTDYVIKVNKGTNCVTVYDKDGEPIRAMICSPSNETPEGTFYTPIKYRWHEMIGNCYAQYCTRITWDGVLFHSVWHYVQGDHSSMSVSAYNVMGQKASHGCVRLLCKDAKWIYDNCALNTKVVIFNGTSKDDPLGRPSFTPLKTSSRTSWDPTDPDPRNPFRGLKPTVKAVSTKVEIGAKKSIYDMVVIKDSAGNELTKKDAKIKITGKVNTKKLGKYKVTFKITDKLGNKSSKTITFKVVDTQKPLLSGVKAKKKVAMNNQQNLLTGITAASVSGKDLTSKIKATVVNKKTGEKVAVKKGKATFKEVGTYKVTYKVTGTNKKTTTKTSTYTVVDKRVKLDVATTISINQGQNFDALSYVTSLKSYKDATLNIINNVKTEGTVEINTPGTYEITYIATQGSLLYTQLKTKVTVTVQKVETTTEQTTTEITTEEATTQGTAEETTSQQESIEETTTSQETVQTTTSTDESGWTGFY